MGSQNNVGPRRVAAVPVEVDTEGEGPLGSAQVVCTQSSKDSWSAIVNVGQRMAAIQTPRMRRREELVLPEARDTVSLDECADLRTALTGEPPAGVQPEVVRVGSKYRLLRDGLGPASLGRIRPPLRRPGRLAGIGKVLQEVALEYGLAEVLEGFVAKYAGASASEKLPPVFGPRIVEDAASRLMAVSGLGADSLFVADGQPVALRLLHHLAAAAFDADAQLPCELAEGVKLGVDLELQVPPGTMCEKGDNSDADSESEFPAFVLRRIISAPRCTIQSSSKTT